MTKRNIQSVLMILGTICLAAFIGSAAQAQYSSPDQSNQGYASQGQSAQGQSGPSTGQPTVIQIHHHHYYQSTGPYSPLIAQQRDPLYAAGTGYGGGFGGPPSSTMEPMPWERDWGQLGFHAYLGKQGQHSGLIVSRVAANSPASKLGLVVGDMIVQVNDEVTNDLSYRQLEILFLKLTSEETQMVTMQVWNSHTGRTSTLKAEFENKEVEQYRANESIDTP